MTTSRLTSSGLVSAVYIPILPNERNHINVAIRNLGLQFTLQVTVAGMYYAKIILLRFLFNFPFYFYFSFLNLFP